MKIYFDWKKEETNNKKSENKEKSNVVLHNLKFKDDGRVSILAY